MSQNDGLRIDLYSWILGLGLPIRGFIRAHLENDSPNLWTHCPHGVDNVSFYTNV